MWFVRWRCVGGSAVCGCCLGVGCGESVVVGRGNSVHECFSTWKHFSFCGELYLMPGFSRENDFDVFVKFYIKIRGLIIAYSRLFFLW